MIFNFFNITSLSILDLFLAQTVSLDFGYCMVNLEVNPDWNTDGSLPVNCCRVAIEIPPDLGV